MTTAGYAIDTSSVMGIEGCTDPADVWAGLDALVAAGRLFTVKVVFDELRRNDPSCHDQLHRHYSKIVVPDTELWALVGPLAMRYPEMSKPFSFRDRADAWILALAQLKGLTVVCEERNDGPRRPRSMSYVCEQEGIPCINLDGLVQDERLLGNVALDPPGT